MIMTTLIVVALSLSSVPAVSATQSAESSKPLDPAVLAYTTFIKRVDLDIPIDRRLVAGLIDQLVSALEGVAIGRSITDDEFYSRVRKGRHELRRFADSPIGSVKREEKGHQLFTGVAELFQDLEHQLGSNDRVKPAVEAVDRAARSLEIEDPLRWQPNAIQNFLVLGGEALRQLSATATRSRR